MPQDEMILELARFVQAGKQQVSATDKGAWIENALKIFQPTFFAHFEFEGLPTAQWTALLSRFSGEAVAIAIVMIKTGVIDHLMITDRQSNLRLGTIRFTSMASAIARMKTKTTESSVGEMGNANEAFAKDVRSACAEFDELIALANATRTDTDEERPWATVEGNDAQTVKVIKPLLNNTELIGKLDGLRDEFINLLRQKGEHFASVAEDAVQEAFLLLHQDFEQGVIPTNFYSYCFTRVCWCASTRVRANCFVTKSQEKGSDAKVYTPRNASTDPETLNRLDARPSADSSPDWSEIKVELKKVMPDFGQEDQEVLIAAIWELMQPQSIAQKLGLLELQHQRELASAEAIGARRKRAFRRLRSLIKTDELFPFA